MEIKEYILGNRKLKSDDLWLEEEVVLEEGDIANCYIEIPSGEEIFGLDMEAYAFFNTYVDYKIAKRELVGELVLYLSAYEETEDKAVYYRLREEEREMLKRKVEDYLRKNDILLPEIPAQKEGEPQQEVCELYLQYFGERDVSRGEVWKEIGKENYFTRDYDEDASWYLYSGEGFDKEIPLPKEIALVMCDKNGKGFFRTRNFEIAMPSLFSTGMQVWEQIRERYIPICEDFGVQRKWLKAFMTEELSLSLLGNGYTKNNYFYRGIETVEDTVIKTFEWLDRDCVIHRTRERSIHTGAQWYLYWIGEEQADYGNVRSSYHIGWAPAGKEKGMAMQSDKGRFLIQVCSCGYEYCFWDAEYHMLNNGRIEKPEITMVEAAMNQLIINEWTETYTLCNYEEERNVTEEIAAVRFRQRLEYL